MSGPETGTHHNDLWSFSIPCNHSAKGPQGTLFKVDHSGRKSGGDNVSHTLSPGRRSQTLLLAQRSLLRIQNTIALSHSLLPIWSHFQHKQILGDNVCGKRYRKQHKRGYRVVNLLFLTSTYSTYTLNEHLLLDRRCSRC